MTETPGGPEQARLHDDRAAWLRWGPYVAERAWGTVREDYSEHGQAWEYFPHDHARSRAYRWSEDGLGAVCDSRQALCLGWAFWNGRDPILKERIFGLTGNQGNHGEDAKELWWYLDSTPTHSWMRWRYLYPVEEYPYDHFVEETRRRSRHDPEEHITDTGVLDTGFWDITVDYAKAGPEDLCIGLRATNRSDSQQTLHILPTLWFRNSWSWGRDDRRPTISLVDEGVAANHHLLGHMTLVVDGAAAEDWLFCDNESNSQRLWGVEGSPFPKDAINDHVVNGLATVNPSGQGTKAAAWIQRTGAPGETVELKLRLSRTGAPCDAGWTDAMRQRSDEADAFYASVIPATVDDEARMIARQALSGMLWSKQFFHYDVDAWLEGDPVGPPPPAERTTGRNAAWRHLNNYDVVSMPDCWEYPWYAAWDLAFHCVSLARVDPVFAKEQLLLLCREWYMHPNGQLPAYEWAFGDVNPPVHAWAALRVFQMDGGTDYDFLERIMHKLLINFTWWVNRKDLDGNNVFEGGFLGLDNIGPLDRSAPLPVPGQLEQSDGTAWMAMYCLNLLDMALTLARHDPTYDDIATKFFEHAASISEAIDHRGLWDEEDGFAYDVLQGDDGERHTLRVRSILGLISLLAVLPLSGELLRTMPTFAARRQWFLANKGALAEHLDHGPGPSDPDATLLALVDPVRLRRVLERVTDPNEFLSDHGIRALSKEHGAKPFTIDLGGQHFSVGYEPGESESGLFGGNSNWRGPVWMPVNFLMVEAIRRYAIHLDDPTLHAVADDVSRRLISLFRRDPITGRRPCFGSKELLQLDPSLHDCLLFHEYFHGDTGAGLGAAHQTGWTGLVAELIIGAAVP